MPRHAHIADLLALSDRVISEPDNAEVWRQLVDENARVTSELVVQLAGEGRDEPDDDDDPEWIEDDNVGYGALYDRALTIVATVARRLGESPPPTGTAEEVAGMSSSIVTDTEM